MRPSKYILPYNHLHYYLFALVIILLGYHYPLSLLLFIPLMIQIKNKNHLISVILFSVAIVIFLFIIIKMPPKNPSGSRFVVKEVKTYKTTYGYIVSQNIHNYYFLDKERYHVGDVLELSYNIEDFGGEKYPGGFDEKAYFSSKRVFIKIKVNQVRKIGKTFTLSSIRETFYKWIDKYPEYTKSYIKALMFSDNSFEYEFKGALSITGLSHLFALSGMHINIMIVLMSFLFDRFKIKQKELYISVILTLYLLICNMPISLFRAVSTYMFFVLLHKKGYTRLDALSLSFITMFIINPFYIYSLSFKLSFIVSFFLTLRENKKGIKDVILMHMTAFLVSLPFVSNMNGGIGIETVFISIVFASLFPFFIMPLVFFSLMPGFYFISEPLFIGFHQAVLKISTFIHLIKLPRIHAYIIILYILLLVYVIVSENNRIRLKRSMIFLFLVIFIYVSPRLNPNERVVFLDVNQGDTSFLSSSFGKCNILIDAHQGTTDYLKTLGDVTIDYFFITHGDLDHASEALMVLSKYNVKYIYTNPYDDSNLIKEIKQLYPLKHTKSGDRFMCGNIGIDVLGPVRQYQDRNDNSLILKIHIANMKILFTGDAGFNAEDDLIIRYGHMLKSDIIHVSHHGGNTGTSDTFLAFVDPKIAVISVGKNNFYGHPNQDVLSRLEKRNIEIRQTKDEQTITYHKISIKTLDIIFKRRRLYR